MGSCFLDIEKMRKPVVFMIAFAILIDMNYFAFAMPYTFNQHRQPRSQLSQLNQLIQGLRQEMSKIRYSAPTIEDTAKFKTYEDDLDQYRPKVPIPFRIQHILH